MTVARKIKSYLTPEGEVVFVDPDPGHLPLIRQFNPAFTIRTAAPPSDFRPNLVMTRAIKTGLPREALCEVDDDVLWQIHADGLAGRLLGMPETSADLLAVKIELAKREFLDCRLCGVQCGVNRFLKPGRCNLMDKAYLAESFVHIGEEAPITPAGTIKLYGCGLNCVGCQSWEVLRQNREVMTAPGRLLEASVWDACRDFDQATTIEFVGGNPTESLVPILKVLARMPPSLLERPVVWNDHGYIMPVAYDLLHGVVDVYLPDFKGSDACVERMAGVKGYWGRVTAGIECMLWQEVRIIVRVLAVPGHIACCHKPALEWLSRYRERLWVSLLEFTPDHRALRDPQLNRRTSKTEVAEMRRLMRAWGLRDIEEKPEEFWRR